MAVVILHGELSRFGQRYDLMVDNAAEAMRALFAQLDGFQRHVADNAFFVRVARKNVDLNSIETDFNQPLSERDVIHIVPEISGAGKIGQIVLGAVMIVAAFWTGGLSLGALSISGSTLAMAGIGLVLGGVSQMLMKPPEFGDNNTEKSQSSSFSSLSNSVAQGSVVPVAYGEMMIGSKVISQAIESYKISGDAVDKPAGIVTSSRNYHSPESYGDFVVDGDNDSVIATNYKVVVN